MLELVDITVQYSLNNKPVLNACHLELQKGELAVLTGDNGTGKSTLMHVISGRIQPSVGQIKINNEDVTLWDENKRAKKIAKVSQNLNEVVFSEMSIAENFALAFKRGQRRGLSPALSQKKYYRDLLNEMGFTSVQLEQPIKTLSGGQRQTFGLLMATLAPCDILLLDEHTAALDPQATQSVLLWTKKIVRDKSLTTLMITHDHSQIANFADRHLMLREGKLETKKISSKICAKSYD